MKMTWKMNSLFITRMAIVVSAAVFLIAQAVILSADAPKTPAASDQAPHDSNSILKRRVVGDEHRASASLTNLQVEEIIGTDGKRTTTYADGTVITVIPGADPRWSMQSPSNSSYTIRTPAGLTYTRTRSRAVTLSNPNDPLSLLTRTDTVSLNGRNYTSVYNAASRTFTDTTPAGQQNFLTVDGQERVLQAQVASLNPVSYTYNARGRLTNATFGTGIEARPFILAYNASGYLESISDPLNRATGYLYDTSGRLTQQTLPDARLLSKSYDANGNVTSVTPPGRPTHNFLYTPVNLVATYTPPNTGAGTNQTVYSYNADRQLTDITRPDGQALTLAYDSAGQLSTLSLSEGQYSFAYNATTGKLTSITAPGGGSISFSYDGPLATSATWTGAVSGSASHTYDNNFLITSQGVNGSNSIAFQYDSDSWLTRAGSLTIARHAQNALITGTTLGNLTDARSYNGFAEITNYSAAHSGANLYTAQYTRDQLGRLTQKTETLGGMTNTFVYAYDLARRLVGVERNGTAVAAYSYDSNSNRLSYTGPGGTVNGTYDNQDRLMQYGGTTYVYTANGELLNKTLSGQTTTYEYDVLGNLKAVTLPDGTQLEYVVDGQNRRLGKRVNGVLVQGFLYQDRLNPIAELDGNNNVVSRFVYGSRDNVPDYLIRGGVTYRILSDHLGSARLVVDVATGALAQRLDYDEFGVVLADTNPGFQPFGFAGGIYDSQTRLVRFGARDYEAEVGRWTAKDPLRFGGRDANLYQYVFNDPLNLIDPSGEQARSCDPRPLPDEPQKPPKDESPRCRKGGQEVPCPPGFKLPSFWERVTDDPLEALKQQAGRAWADVIKAGNPNYGEVTGYTGYGTGVRQ